MAGLPEGVVMLQSQRCSRCRRIQRFEFSIADELWNLVGHGDALCIECFLEALDDVALTNEIPKIAIEIEDFKFLGVVGHRFTCILVDAREDEATA